MALSSKFWLLSVLFAVSYAKDVPCPFNEDECTCTETDEPVAMTYENAVCITKSASLTVFKPAPNGKKYKIANEMTMSYNVYKIPAMHFVAFESITSLVLLQNEALRPITAEWNDYAFAGVTIFSLTVSTLAGMVPLPRAVKNLGNRELGTLYIKTCKEPISLADNAFRDITDLKTLSIDDTQITSIGKDAFNNSKHLQELTLTKAGLKEFPTDAMKDLSTITRLILNDNEISSLPNLATVGLDSLKMLSIAGNKLGDAISKGALDNLPPKLAKLYVDAVDIVGSIPKQIFAKNPQLTIFSATYNKIDHVAADDLVDAGHLKGIYLDNNPITGIAFGAFSKMSSADFISLRNISIESVDLSIFNGLKDNIQVLLGENTQLTTLAVSDVNKVPPSADFYFEHSGLTMIDSTIFGLLQAKPTVTIDIRKNQNLKCEGYAWMAYFVTCSKQLKIKDAICSDKSGQPLDEYLKFVAPNPCSFVSPSTAGPTGSGTTTITDTTGSGTTGNPSTNPPPPQTTTGGKPPTPPATTTGPPQPLPTTQGASQSQSMLSLIFSMGAILVIFKNWN
jgi:hypothetical protein